MSSFSSMSHLGFAGMSVFSILDGFVTELLHEITLLITTRVG